MPTFVVGDIHGHLEPLADLLQQLRPQLASGDTLVFLGDYIDRGPDSRACVDAILAVRQETSADVVCLRGNHEDWMLQTRADYCRHSWLLGMDGLDTVQSYSADAFETLRMAMAVERGRLYSETVRLPYERFFDALPPAHVDFFDDLRTCHGTSECICAHGGVDPAVASLDDQPRRALIWGASGFPKQYRGDQVVVYGHWNNATLDASGWPSPLILGNTIGIDTIAFGVLTAIRLPDRRVFQSPLYQSAVRDD